MLGGTALRARAPAAEGASGRGAHAAKGRLRAPFPPRAFVRSRARAPGRASAIRSPAAGFRLASLDGIDAASDERTRAGGRAARTLPAISVPATAALAPPPRARAPRP